MWEDTLRWCLLPEFDVQLARPAQRRVLRARIGSAVVPDALRPFPLSRLRVFGDVLVVTRSVNEERVLDPVIGRVSDLPRSLTIPISGSSTRDVSARAATQWVERALDHFGRTELAPAWRHAVNSTVHQLRWWRAFDLTRFRCVLIARQTHPLLRALIVAADAQHVPLAFIPHSPLTAFQTDLPVSHAALRGPAEREWVVRATGADPTRIATIGNPATSLLDAQPPALDQRLPGVLAVSPDPQPVLQRVIALMLDAGLSDVTIAAHPRSDLRMLRRLLPHGWSLAHSGRTADLLRRGHPWVIQMSSGVAWEAAALGVPVGDVRLSERPPDYPFLADATIFPPLRTAEDVRRFVANGASVDRHELRSYAQRWCATDGEDSVLQARSFLAGIDGVRPRIVDGWAPGGTLHRASQLANL